MHTLTQELLTQLNRVILGKEHPIKLAVACLYANGHLLIEDLPGMGKTTLALGLAQVFGLEYQRIQFTSDLLPADIVGMSIFDQQTQSFRYHPGPLFHHLILADEINRASPKSQSALLEAMEERQVSVDGTTHRLPDPFFVIATQNPQSSSGTQPLPESQLDRFLMCISLGYPSEAAERALLEGNYSSARSHPQPALLDRAGLNRIQQQVNQVTASAALISYVQRLVGFTRNYSEFTLGVSPRGSLSLLRSAKAWAFIHGRDYVIPDDVRAVLGAVIGHRVRARTHTTTEHLINHLHTEVSVIES